jgi:hypothetical protein
MLKALILWGIGALASILIPLSALPLVYARAQKPNSIEIAAGEALCFYLPSRREGGLLGNSAGIKRAGAVRNPGPRIRVVVAISRTAMLL